MSVLLVAVFVVAAYTPGVGALHTYGADWRGGQALTEAECACGAAWSFGTLFVFEDGRAVTCRDRGLFGASHLDLVVLGPGARGRALAFGRQRREALVFANMGRYRQTCAQLARLGERVSFCGRAK